jgi:pSer/pThr/pTyr-binding forkhead associated (FHA) protein
LGAEITFTWLDTKKSFKSFELPIHLGRSHSSEFVVNDPRVSRAHARIEWRNGRIMFVDVSSYGSWVRFEGSNSDVLLRREECALHGHGDLVLGGSSFSDPTVPVVHFFVR